MNPVPSSDDDEPFENEPTTTSPTAVAVNDHSKLGLWQGVALLTADCLGVGVLALPEDIRLLGWVFGLSFLILQLPINYYAGSILAWTALQVEQEWRDEHAASDAAVDDREGGETSNTGVNGVNVSMSLEMTATNYRDRDNTNGNASEAASQGLTPFGESHDGNTGGNGSEGQPPVPPSPSQSNEKDGLFHEKALRPAGKQDIDEPPTVDLIGISHAVFDQHHLASRRHEVSTSRHSATTIVLLLYYLNLFLVLGDYILVMSHAVAAVFGDDICITLAGLIASTLMFAICQLNTMALLGQYVSMASLAAMIIVLGQCIYETHQTTTNEEPEDVEDTPSLLRQFSALASICFAVGSQKLFLNIRFELADKERHAAPVLARSLAIYGLAYISVIVFSGSKPPSFLFDAIPKGSVNRRIAGLLLWGHVAVSYAINSQALCSSIERLLFHVSASDTTSRIRWMLLTFSLALSSYLVANGIPFFKDLVALIGAATSVPLTLSLPPVLYQHWQQWTRLSRRDHHDPSWNGVVRRSSTRSWSCVASSALLLYSVVFLGVGLAGSLASVQRDWAHAGHPPFSCTHS